MASRTRHLKIGTGKSAMGASVGRLKFVSTSFFCSRGWPRDPPFKSLKRMTVKPHFSETQNDRECGRVNCNILLGLFNFDLYE